MPDFQIFILTFLPLFIVLDAVGTLPFVVSLTEGMTSRQRRSAINLAIITATVVGMVFLFFGQFILSALGITVGSLSIAGGIILFVLSLRYMTTGHIVEATKQEMVAVVPIGTPLTVGPATITTLLLLASRYPLPYVLISFALNLFIAWVIFLLGIDIVRFLGVGGVRAFSQVFNLLLAAIAISMIIQGLSILGIISVAG